MSAASVERARLEYLRQASVAARAVSRCAARGIDCPCSWWSLQTDAASIALDLAVSEWAARKAVAY